MQNLCSELIEYYSELYNVIKTILCLLTLSFKWHILHAMCILFCWEKKSVHTNDLDYQSSPSLNFLI